MNALWLICLLTFIIHTTETLSYAIRFAGVQTGRIAVAMSLVGITLLLSRTSNLIQGPFTGGLMDQAAILHTDPSWQLHTIIAASSVGTLAAIVLFPTFVQISKRVISHLELAGSIPQMLRTAVTVDSIRRVRHHVRIPSWQAISRFRIKGIPKRLLLLNCLGTAIYTSSVLSVLYATLLAPDYKATVLMSSGMINGFATIFMTILVDPQVALLTEKAMQGKATQESIRDMYLWLMISRFFGTLLAQLFLVPAAYWVAWLSPLFH
ncbi:lipid II flippase Amj family protein [Brevibacillus sp. SAFN-007a]|uniref:lipid II flippase Amj family protein n=1 Tax=Brevibacillus sp. SAFN-007a TaxID=3436862 RepID=UPI003F7D7AFE